jgi:hypothetical protein
MQLSGEGGPTRRFSMAETETEHEPETETVNVNEVFPSKYLKAEVDVMEDQPITVTIESVDVERMGQGADAQDKFVLQFRELEKGMVLNKTNSMTIARLYGDESDDWVGKRITLYSTEVQYKDEMVASIRIKSKEPKGPGKAVPTGVPARPIMPVNQEPPDDDIPF